MDKEWLFWHKPTTLKDKEPIDLLKELGVEKIHSSVPFAKEIFNAKAELSYFLTLKKFNQLTATIPPERLRTLALLTMVRQVDKTGLIPNLIGAFTNKTDVYRCLVRLVEQEINLLGQEPKWQDTKEKVLAMAEGDFSLGGLLAMDRIQGRIIDYLSARRSKSAWEFRQKNNQQLTELNYLLRVYSTTGRLPSSLEPPQRQDAEKAPPVEFDPIYDINHQVAEVQQTLIIPTVMPLKGWLVDITPEVFMRGLNEQYTDLNQNEKVLLTIGKVGHPLVRSIIDAFKSVPQGQYEDPALVKLQEMIRSRS
jgi:hypothetical protein